jgi:hypothetical protein
MIDTSSVSKVKRIAALNDSLRRTFMGGKVMLTAGVAALDDELKAKVLTAVREFTNFNSDNDPYGEHDCATFEVEGGTFMFKVDYYDRKSMDCGSEDPADPNMTTRVLTIMHASDY